MPFQTGGGNIAKLAYDESQEAKQTASSAVTSANEANAKSDFTQKQLDQVAGASTIDPAVEQMKVDTEGTTHASPDARLRSDYNKVNALLAQRATKQELEVEKDRISNLVANAGDTDGNAELLDIRVTATGTIENTAGEAIRKQFKEAITGTITEPKEIILSKYEHYRDDQLLRADGGSIGKTLDQVPYSGATGTVNVLIDVEKYHSISYPLFKTSQANGCLMVDKNNIVIWEHTNTTLETGSLLKIDIPTNAKYFVFSVSVSLMSLKWDVEFPSEIKRQIEELYVKGETLENLVVLGTYGKYEESYISAIDVIGENLADIARGFGGGAHLIKIDVADRVGLSYPVFKSTSGYGSVIIDENDVVIWGHSETVQETGTSKEILIPTGAKYFILGISASLSLLDWSISFLKEIPKSVINEMITDIYDLKNNVPISDFALDDNNYLTLGALRTEILDNKIPYHKGYLFHKLDNDRSLWYGKNFDNIKKIGTPEFHPKDCLLGMSPKDGRVIATRRGRYDSLWVWDGTKTHELFGEGSPVRPKGWLYNSGVEFTKDANGVEYCLFAEYGGDVTAQSGGFNVWRGTYPYTSESDWEVVFYQDYDGEVTDKSNAVSHFHQVRRDPWTNILYLTSGDASAYCKWWYSLDHGKTWILLSTNPTSGFEDHVMRCINFIFTKDYIYWAVDHGVNHSLNRIERNAQTGIIDIGTRFKMTDLPYAQATNTLCYVESPNGLFMFDRWDYGPQFEPYFKNPIQVQFWSFEDEQLHTVTQVRMSNNGWGGHRGKCYTNYTSGAEHRPAMGFSDDTRCYFDIVAPRTTDIGTVFYEVNNGVLKYIV